MDKEYKIKTKNFTCHLKKLLHELCNSKLSITQKDKIKEKINLLNSYSLNYVEIRKLSEDEQIYFEPYGYEYQKLGSKFVPVLYICFTEVYSRRKILQQELKDQNSILKQNMITNNEYDLLSGDQKKKYIRDPLLRNYSEHNMDIPSIWVKR